MASTDLDVRLGGVKLADVHLLGVLIHLKVLLANLDAVLLFEPAADLRQLGQGRLLVNELLPAEGVTGRVST